MPHRIALARNAHAPSLVVNAVARPDRYRAARTFGFMTRGTVVIGR